MTTTTTDWRCSICASPKQPDEKSRYCVQCAQNDGDAFRAIAQLKKAIKIHDVLVRFGGLPSDRVPMISNEGRRVFEREAGVSESSDTTWAMVAYLTRQDR